MIINNKLSVSKFRAIVGLAIVSLYFIVVLMIDIFPFLGRQQGLLDFGSFYASGLQIQNGENPYSPDSEYVWKFNFSRVGAVEK